jgi:hypothetical protein
VTHENAALLARAEAEFVAGAQDLYRATAQIKAIRHG